MVHYALENMRKVLEAVEVMVTLPSTTKNVAEQLPRQAVLNEFVQQSDHRCNVFAKY